MRRREVSDVSYEVGDAEITSFQCPVLTFPCEGHGSAVFVSAVSAIYDARIYGCGCRHVNRSQMYRKFRLI